jgi:serine/threonine protein phosphatase PrpC
MDHVADAQQLTKPELARKTDRDTEVLSALVYVDVAGLTHPGKVRENNEDQFLVGRTERDLEVLLTSLHQDDIPRHSRETGYAMIVADGIGGVEGGEVASRLAIKTLLELVIQTPDWIMRLDDDLAEEFVRRASDRYRKADAAIRKQALSDPSLGRMGTTLTLAVSLAADLFVIHVGDSRAYLLRNGQLQQLTRDQTVVQSLLDAGVLTHQQAATHNMRHVLTQALGQHADKLKIEVQSLKLADGDCLLLCTDGLTDMVPDGEISAVLVNSGKAEQQCQLLMDKALEAGGKDNITVVVAHYSFRR